MKINRPVARKWRYAWNVWCHTRLLFCSTVVNGKISRWVLWNTCVATTILITQFKGWEVQSRMTQYAWTYVTSCDNNPSQNPGASFHRFPSNRDRRARWLSCLGWMRASWGSLLQVCSRHLPDGDAKREPMAHSGLLPVCHGSKHHRNYSCYFGSIIIQLWRTEPGRSGCMPVDIARPPRSCSYFNWFSLHVCSL